MPVTLATREPNPWAPANTATWLNNRWEWENARGATCCDTPECQVRQCIEWRENFHNERNAVTATEERQPDKAAVPEGETVASTKEVEDPATCELKIGDRVIIESDPTIGAVGQIGTLNAVPGAVLPGLSVPYGEDRFTVVRDDGQGGSGYGGGWVVSGRDRLRKLTPEFVAERGKTMSTAEHARERFTKLMRNELPRIITKDGITYVAADLVYAEAAHVADVRGWCDGGVSETFSRFGLPGVGGAGTRVQLPYTFEMNVTLPNTVTTQEALAAMIIATRREMEILSFSVRELVTVIYEGETEVSRKTAPVVEASLRVTGHRQFYGTAVVNNGFTLEHDGNARITGNAGENTVLLRDLAAEASALLSASIKRGENDSIIRNAEIKKKDTSVSWLPQEQYRQLWRNHHGMNRY